VRGQNHRQRQPQQHRCRPHRCHTPAARASVAGQLWQSGAEEGVEIGGSAAAVVVVAVVVVQLPVGPQPVSHLGAAAATARHCSGVHVLVGHNGRCRTQGIMRQCDGHSQHVRVCISVVTAAGCTQPHGHTHTSYVRDNVCSHGCAKWNAWIRMQSLHTMHMFGGWMDYTGLARQSTKAEAQYETKSGGMNHDV
jgi:hypothetical protein